MSEYQYYEFQAIDRPLDRVVQEELRAISSRATISATSFVNEYHWGDFKGNPRQFMERWFDLHLYFANWGTRRLMMRVPRRFLDPNDLSPFIRELDWVEIWTAGVNLIIDINRDEEAEYGLYDEEQTDSSWLAGLAPLRTDVLSGDLRMFYLLWLVAVQEDLVPDEAEEPLAGIGPLSGTLESFAEFLIVDSFLVDAAAETGLQPRPPSSEELREIVTRIPDLEKTNLLLRTIQGDIHVTTELRRMTLSVRSPQARRRTAGDLRIRAREIEGEHKRAEAERTESLRLRKAEEVAKARRDRLGVLRHRGEKVWREIEIEIERRNATGYDNALTLIGDLQALAVEDKSLNDFNRRFAAIRAHHERKRTFVERLDALQLSFKNVAA
jgi:hypothetical protein